jgi:hypothetical protein
LCDGSNTPDDITAQVTNTFDQPTDHVAADVRAALDRLRELGLLAHE